MTENNEKPGYQFNVGKVEAWPNGCFINIGMHLKNPLSSLMEGDSLTYHCGKLNEDYDVDFEYADLSPAEARQLAKELLMYAKEIEADFQCDWVVLCEGKIQEYIDENGESMGWWIYGSEEEAKEAVKNLNDDNPSKFKYTYRLMTMDETYRYLNH